ncbi:Uncharacterized protein LOCC1_G005325 [Lachnellula occidentalis]|uniref:DUF1479-domain-containing protein n=1 Tax=Lachnellula occidentalis TaxID=215460 RepID=A0A8H8UEN3_9HELO|nr:Uncharacterized protein LOCC1_G005325 [Lachnellula occidentalis]
MPGTLLEWPAWPEFIKIDTLDPDFLKAKHEIIAQYGEPALRASWLETCAKLDGITEDIINRGSSIIPIIKIQDVLRVGFTEEQEAEIKRVGSFVIRDVIPEREATELFQDLKNYVANNQQHITGWPTETPSILSIYTSPVQMTVRTHPNQLALQRHLNALWHDSTGETSPDPLLYFDGVRIRAPNQTFMGLGPHIDAGSLCRWADPAYRLVYDKVFSGHVSEHDSFDLGIRKSADQYMFPGSAQSTFFRSFQGWTALTRAAPREGSLMLYPNVATAIAYVLLRPFFHPPANEADILDAEKWTFNAEDGFFPGTYKPNSQLLSPTSHPHLRLMECMVNIPTMKAGDTVWWHSDVCHAVEPEHTGKDDASVVYVAASPTTEINKAYTKRQLEAVLAGRAPPDFRAHGNADETKFKGYVGFAGMSEEAKKALGI